MIIDLQQMNLHSDIICFNDDHLIHSNFLQGFLNPQADRQMTLPLETDYYIFQSYPNIILHRKI